MSAPPALLFWRMSSVPTLDSLFRNKVKGKMWYNEGEMTSLSFINMNVSVTKTTNSVESGLSLTSILPRYMGRRDKDQPVFFVEIQ